MDQRRRRLIAVAGVLFAIALTTNAEAGSLHQEVAKKVTQLVDLLRDESATEYKEVRGVSIGKLKGGITVAVAVFTLEGFSFGNDYTQFLAVFSTTRSPHDERNLPHIPPRLALIDLAAVGGRFWRNVESKHIRVREERRGIIISFDTVEFTPEDAACCPSQKSHAKYAVELRPGSRLKEVNKGTSRNEPHAMASQPGSSSLSTARSASRWHYSSRHRQNPTGSIAVPVPLDQQYACLRPPPRRESNGPTER
jgi:hypothetical protein